MKELKFSIYLLIIVCALLMPGCRSVSDVYQADVGNMPATYSRENDTVTSAGINWKHFFTDSNLQQLVGTALERNFDVLATMQRIEASRAQVGASKGRLLPSISAYASAGQSRFGLYTMDGAGNTGTNIYEDELIPSRLPDHYLGLHTSWEVDVWGKLRNLKVAALSRYLASVEGRNLIVTNLVADVTSAYYELLSLDVQLDIVQKTISLQENALTLVRVQKETGVANELAVEQFEAQLLSSQAMEKEIRQEILETEAKINFLLGQYPNPIQREKGSFFDESPVRPQVGIPSELLRFRPDVRQAEYELLAASAEVRSARAAFLPSFNITGEYGFQAYKTSFLFTTPESIAYSIFGGLTAPLINRSAIKAEFNTAKASELQSIYNYQKAILNGYLEVYNEIANMRNLEDVYELKSRQVERLTKSIETSDALFRSRRASYVEVILTQANALQAQLELVDVKRRHFLSQIALYKALGGGWTE